MRNKIVIFDGSKDDVKKFDHQDWLNTPQIILDYYNNFNTKLQVIEKHYLVNKLSEKHDVKIITTSILNFYERAGSEDILHLHGEMTKKRNLKTNEIESWEPDETISIEDGYRPHVVWFGEYPYNMEETTKALSNADYLFIVGTSLEIGYVTPLLGTVNENAKVFFINPEKIGYLDAFIKGITYLEKGAAEGISEIIEKEKL